MDLQTIFSWFKRGCKPTEAQFKATFLSFRHKDNPVPMEDVSGLSYALSTKSDIGHTHTLAEISDYDGGDKEVLNAMVAQNAEQLETFTKVIGMYYIQLDDVLLYRYEHDEDTDTDVLNEVEPDGKVVYSAYDADEHLHIYLYNVLNMEFQDVTDRPVDKTIYTSDLDTLVTRQLENGVYSVVYINSGLDGNMFGDAYMLTVGDGSIPSRVLECRTGWARTVLVDGIYQWQWHRYQDQTDNSLLTTAKTIVAAINELWNKFADYLKGIQHVTYAQLKALRDNAQLKPGQWYRITDYVTTVANDTEARSAGHPFDILVMATSAATLGEDALAVKSARDNEVTVERFYLLSFAEQWDDDKCFVRYPDADGAFDGEDYLAFRHAYDDNGVERYLYAYTKEDDEAVKVYVPYLTTGTEPDTVKTNWVAITEATGLDELVEESNIHDADM